MGSVLCSTVFAAGRGAVAEALAASVGSLPGARILVREEEPRRLRLRVAIDSSHARGVFEPLRAACEAIDLRTLEPVPDGGRRPLGAIELLSFVPLDGGTLEGCVALAHALGKRVGRELDVPVYYFGAAALRPERRDLDRALETAADPRTLFGKSDVERQPDEGPPDDGREGHPSRGATAIGARRIEVAFEVELETRDAELARELARHVTDEREGLPGIDAAADAAPSGRALVRLTLRDVSQIGLVRAYEELERLARERGVEVRESRVIGLVPRSVLQPGTAERTRLSGFDPHAQVLEELLGR
jgi:glutamate formiminotransferase